MSRMLSDNDGTEIVQTWLTFGHAMSTVCLNGLGMDCGWICEWAAADGLSRVFLGSVQSVAQTLGTEYFLLLCARGARSPGPLQLEFCLAGKMKQEGVWSRPS